jgi:5'-3' exonuclease
MGIQDLFKVLNDRCPECIQNFHLSHWRGKSIAVDVSIFLNKYVKSAGDRLWMNSFFLFLCTLKKHNVKCVLIFDGSSFPAEKMEEQEARREQSRKATERLNKAIAMRNLLLANYIPKDIPLPDSIQEQCQSLLGYYAKTTSELVDDVLEESIVLVNRQKYQRNIDWVEATDVYDALKELIDRLERQTAPITNEQRELAWDIVKMMGLPTFQADGEAEALCAYLCIHGYVDAVLSEDTDVLAYGTPWMLAFKDYKLSDEKVKGIFLPNVLDALNYTVEEFKDLCILLSCDYNKRVKGYPPTKSGKLPKNAKSIGWVGALAMIDEHRTLEECENYIEDIEPLKYQRCRELFSTITKEELLSIIQTKPYSIKPKIEEIRAFILRERLTISVDYIEECWKPVEIVIHSESEESTEDSEGDLTNVSKFPNDNKLSDVLTSDTKTRVNKINDKLIEILKEEDTENTRDAIECYVKLIAECENNEGDEKCISFYVMFRDEEQYTEANDNRFDSYIELFGVWVSEWNEGYYVVGTIECEKVLAKKPKDVEILDLSDV